MLAHLFGILADQLFDVRQHQDPCLRPVLKRVLAQRRHDVAFAGARWQHQSRVAGVARREPRVKLIDGVLLIVTEH